MNGVFPCWAAAPATAENSNNVEFMMMDWTTGL